MKLLHVADLHIGKQVNGYPMLDDQRAVLDQVVGLLRERADALLVAGDVYDKAQPSAEAVAVLDRFWDACARTGKPVVAVYGNHDSPERMAYARAALASRGIHVSPVYDGRIEPVRLEDAEGPVDVWPVPFLRPGTVRPHFPDADASTFDEAVRLVLGSCELDPAARNVVVSHQFVVAAGSETLRSDSETASAGGLDQVGADAYDAFDYAALGHIHRPQRVGRDACRYAGSPLKYSFSEIPYPKSCPLVELGGRRPDGGCEVSVELVALKAPHDMRQVRGPLEKLLSPEVVGAADPEDYLRVVLTDEEPPIGAMGRLRASYPNVMALEFDNARSRAASAAGAAADVDAGKDVLGHFEDFFELRQGRPMDDEQRALAARALQDAGFGGKEA